MSLEQPLNDIKTFLGLDAEALQQLEDFRPVLAGNAYTLARNFYAYLQRFPATAARLQDIAPGALEKLTAAQARHMQELLRRQLEPEWLAQSHQVGRRHFALGIQPTWIAGAYLLYWQHWAAILQDPEQVPPDAKAGLESTLLRLWLGDLMAQLEGYAEAFRENDLERQSLFAVLLDVLMSPTTWSGDPQELLGLVCQQLGVRSAQVLWAHYGLTESSKNRLCFVPCGSTMTAIDIPENAEDPAWRALHEQRFVIWRRDGAEEFLPAAWAAQAEDVAELGFFPFGREPLQGVGVVAAREAGYFQRVGTEYFLAFSHLGDLLLRLRLESLRDPLTDLPNRKWFLDQFQRLWAQTQRHERLLGVVMLDLDGFKDINDRYGHAAGDALLLQVVQRIQSIIRTEDVFARLGGDEFALLLPDLRKLDDMEFVCSRMLEALRQPFLLPGEDPIQISSSIGVTIYPLDDADPDTLLHHADVALYQAKMAGKDQCELHTWHMDVALQASAAQREQLALALAEGRVQLHYQPIWHLGKQKGERLWGCESLLRVADGKGNWLSPAQFGAALDHPRLARELGCRVLSLATHQALQWCRSGRKIRVTVNISAYHFLDKRFLSDVQHALQQVPDLPPARLEIEITETAPLQDLQAAREIIIRLREWGVGVALDDYGTGNASLTYLQRFPISVLKIDQSFVRDILNDPTDLAIIAGVLTSARMLGLEVVAEGVETARHAELLGEIGCQLLQGYVIARPMPPEQLLLWFEALPEQAIPFPVYSAGVGRELLVAHRHRVRQFLAALGNEEEFPAQVLEMGAENRCDLGVWLALSRGHRPKLPLWEALEAQHQELHHCAREAKAAWDAGDRSGATVWGKKISQLNGEILQEIEALERTTE